MFDGGVSLEINIAASDGVTAMGAQAEPEGIE
jgi:hypothetical protein